LPAAAALAGLAHRTAEAALRRLVTANLVEQVSATRYRLHDLVRLHAKHVCDTDESSGETAAAFERLLRWYATVANAAALMLYPGRPAGYPSGRGWHEDEGHPVPFRDDADAWEWLEAERPNFATLAGAAARYGLAPLAWHFTDSLWGFFQFRSYHETWLAVAHAGLHATEQAGDELGQAVMHLGVATAHWGRGDDRNYLRHSALAVPLAKLAGWPAGEAKALRNQSDAHRGLGEPRQALDCLERALTLHGEQEDSAEIAHDLIVLAHTHAQLGDLQRSLTHLEQAVELAGKGGSLLTEMIGLYALGRVQAGLGRQADAEVSYRTSLRHARELGIADRAAFTLGALAEMACAAGRRAEAQDLLRQALGCGSTRTETVAEVHNMAGRVTFRLGRADIATEHHEQALDAARLTGNVPIQAEALLGLAEVRTASARRSEARVLAQQAKSLVEPGGYRILTAQALTTLGEVELADGNGQRAGTYLEQALRLHRATGHHPGEVRTLRSLHRS
jgi:tetratricopeptide (TPR) repeat protein